MKKVMLTIAALAVLGILGVGCMPNEYVSKDELNQRIYDLQSRIINVQQGIIDRQQRIIEELSPKQTCTFLTEPLDNVTDNMTVTEVGRTYYSTAFATSPTTQYSYDDSVHIGYNDWVHRNPGMTDNISIQITTYVGFTPTNSPIFHNYQDASNWLSEIYNRHNYPIDSLSILMWNPDGRSGGCSFSPLIDVQDYLDKLHGNGNIP